MSKGSLWVRYSGSKVVHRAHVFPIPTDVIPTLANPLKRRHDIEEIWYIAAEEFDQRHAYCWWSRSGCP
jgi:hypothetical protein